MYLNFAAYMSDFWNIFDMIRVLLTALYCFVELGVSKESGFELYTYYTLALLMIMVWLRLISYLRLFSKTRALIRLVVEVTKDMGAFAIVLLMACLCFTLTYNIIT